MDLCISELHLRRPPWRLRNKVIAENLLPNKSVLDLGGGAANLLKYYSPTDYMCVDGMDIPEVDKVIDLNTDYQNELTNNWDYAVNSGILEFVANVELYLDRQKSLAKEYIFTWHPDKLMGKQGHDWIQEIIKKNYSIEKSISWGPQKIYRCLLK